MKSITHFYILELICLQNTSPLSLEKFYYYCRRETMRINNTIASHNNDEWSFT